MRATAIARRRLDDELGLEPGRELHELERAILAHDPALEAPGRAQAHSSPAAVAGPAGWDRDRCRRSAAARAARGGRGEADRARHEHGAGSRRTRSRRSTPPATAWSERSRWGRDRARSRSGRGRCGSRTSTIRRSRASTRQRLSVLRAFALAGPPTGIAAAGGGSVGGSVQREPRHCEQRLGRAASIRSSTRIDARPRSATSSREGPGRWRRRGLALGRAFYRPADAPGPARPDEVASSSTPTPARRASRSAPERCGWPIPRPATSIRVDPTGLADADRRRQHPERDRGRRGRGVGGRLAR